MPQLAEHAEGQHRAALDLRRESAQLERRATEPSELLAKRRLGERVLLRFDGRFLRLDRARGATRERGPHHERLPDGRRHHEIHWLPPPEFAPGKRLPQPRRELRIVGLPDGLPRCEPAEVEGLPGKRQLHPPRRDRLGERQPRLKHLVHAAAEGIVTRGSAVERHAVAAFHARGELHRHTAAAHGLDPAQPHAPLRARRRGHQHLVVAALEPAGREATRERELHLLDIARRKHDRLRGHGRIDRPPVVLRDVGDVFRRLEAALDLERRHAGREQLRGQRIGGEVLRREQVFLVPEIDVLAVADEVVGEPAGLGALAAIGAPPAERLAREALPRIRHAQRAVHEHLERHRRLPTDRHDLVDRELPREHHPLAAELLSQCDRLGARHGHLRRGVQRQIGADAAHELRRTHVLHEHGIDASRRHGFDHLCEIGQFF